MNECAHPKNDALNQNTTLMAHLLLSTDTEGQDTGESQTAGFCSGWGETSKALREARKGGRSPMSTDSGSIPETTGGRRRNQWRAEGFSWRAQAGRGQ